jgi:hypothetical protein
MTRANELVQILDSISSNSWEDAALKIVDVFAADISLWVIYQLFHKLQYFRLNSGTIRHSPQPFRLDSFRACDITFPQPSLEDRLYVDQKSFFANINQVSF